MEENKKYFLFADEYGDSNLSVYEKSFPVFTLCGIIVSREQIRKLGDIYSQALTFLLERAVFYVDDVNPEVGGTIDAMLERRGKVEDKKLSERYNELREKGTYWVTPERPNPAFDIIKGNIYVSDGKELGIKVIK